MPYLCFPLLDRPHVIFAGARTAARPAPDRPVKRRRGQDRGPGMLLDGVRYETAVPGQAHDAAPVDSAPGAELPLLCVSCAASCEE